MKSVFAPSDLIRLARSVGAKGQAIKFCRKVKVFCFTESKRRPTTLFNKIAIRVLSTNTKKATPLSVNENLEKPSNACGGTSVSTHDFSHSKNLKILLAEVQGQCH